MWKREPFTTLRALVGIQVTALILGYLMIHRVDRMFGPSTAEHVRQALYGMDALATLGRLDQIRWPLAPFARPGPPAPAMPAVRVGGKRAERTQLLRMGPADYADGATEALLHITQTDRQRTDT